MRTMTFIDEVNLKFEDDKTYSRNDIMSIIFNCPNSLPTNSTKFLSVKKLSVSV